MKKPKAKAAGKEVEHQKKLSAWRHLLLPFKVIKWVYTKTRESQEKAKIEKMKPKNMPQEKEFEILKAFNGDIESFNKLVSSEGKIGIIIGARGTGKSALGMRILENIKARTNKKVYAIGFDSTRVPNWINIVSDVNSVLNNSFILIDESGITFSSRESMSSANKLLTDLLLIARHKGLSILFITQNSSNIEINTLRQADYLLFKPSSLLQLNFERKVIKNLYEEVSKWFEKFKEPSTTYIYSEAFRGFVKNELPSFWSDRLSRSFSNTGVGNEKKE